MIWWIAAASAQDRTVWDFDTTFPSALVAWSGSASFGEPVVPWSGDALRIGMVPGSGFPAIDAYVDVAYAGDGTLVVTHEELRFDARTDSALSVSIGAVITSPEIQNFLYGGEAVGSAWAPVSIGLRRICGHSAGLELSAAGNWSPYGGSQVDIDDVAMTGPVCAVFTDVDGDGLCRQGIDADGDGTCTADGERLPFGESADCDDLTFGPSCLELEATPLVPGGTVTFTARGALPGETVRIVGASGPGRRCPAALGGACLSFDHPKLLGGAVADLSGVAVVVVNVPLTLGPPLQAQALRVRPGEVGVLSPVIDVVP